MKCIWPSLKWPFCTSRTKINYLEIVIPADYPCLAQRVGTMRALSGLAPIRLSYLRLRDQRRNSPKHPQVLCQRLTGLFTKSLKTKGKDSGKPLRSRRQSSFRSDCRNPESTESCLLVSIYLSHRVKFKRPNTTVINYLGALRLVPMAAFSGTHEWSWAIVRVMSYTCAFPARTALSAVRHTGLLAARLHLMSWQHTNCHC